MCRSLADCHAQRLRMRQGQCANTSHFFHNERQELGLPERVNEFGTLAVGI